jgi:hypothetical protein
MTAVASSPSPTVRSDVDTTWGQSKSLSFHSYGKAPDEQGLIVDFDEYGDGRRLVLHLAARQLDRLINLPEGWDGGHAKPVLPTTAILAMQVLGLVTDDLTPAPHVFPLPDGGVQLEWLINGNGLEIEISPNGELGALGIDAGGLTQVDHEFGAGTDTSSLKMTKSYLQTISKTLLPIW